jgi:hypothetical protein
MKTLILFVAITMASGFAMAGGGKNRTASSPIYDVNGDTVGTVIPVPDGCEVVVPQSGKSVYVMCDEE